MPRWRQDAETGKLVPIDESARRVDGTAFIQGDIEPFVSPLDGSVISDRKQMREHMQRHGVVHASEFSPDFYAEKRRERERLYTGEHTREQSQRRKEEIHRIIDHLERR